MRRSLQILAIVIGAAALAAVGDPARAQVTGLADVVTACGTPNSTYVVGTQRPITQDTTGTLCDAGGSGGSGTGVDARWFGFVGDGASHPLSNYYGTLAAAQAVYPWALSLGDEVDGMAMQAAIYAVSPYNLGYQALDPVYGGTAYCPAAPWRFNETIFVNPNVAVVGLGSTLVPTSWTGTIANAGMCLGLWTGPNGIPAFSTSNMQQLPSVGFTGTVTSATNTTVNITDASLGLNFLGSVIVVDGQTRAVFGQSYGTGQYTLGVLNPWITNPTGGDPITITGQAAGTRYAGPDGMPGGSECGSGNFSYASGVRIENINLVTLTEASVAFEFNCAASATLTHSASFGFNVG